MKRHVRSIDVKSIALQPGRPLGRGAQGMVKRGKLKLAAGQEVDVAVKIVPVDEDAEEALAREVEQLAKLKHLNIVKLYGEARNEDTGELYAVMELAELGAAGALTPCLIPAAVSVSICAAHATCFSARAWLCQ
eukprot:3211811-Rhodomonas_salina.1